MGASTANTFYAIGSAITVPRNGIMVISMSGHISGGGGYIQLQLSRNSNTYLYGSTSVSLFGNFGNIAIASTTSSSLYTPGTYYNTTEYDVLPYFLLPVYSGDSLQFYEANNTADEATYIDDVLVMLI
ncbi:MAG: hypothetical protein QXP04_04625 [Candidatus Nanoarchaeia archaeon]|nr:hypothetical protein [Candidatus Jingweiarchaeum tengchongense]